MTTEATTTTQEKAQTTCERIAPNLYRRGGQIVARVRVNGKPTWRSTGTSDVKLARQWLKRWQHEAFLLNAGIETPDMKLHRARLTVGEVLDAYVAAGHPTKKMQTAKTESTLESERRALRPLYAYFRLKAAAGLTLAEADTYFAWRTTGGYVSEYKLRGHDKTRHTKGGKRAVDMELIVLSNALNLAVRRGDLKTNPLAGRGRYTSAQEVRHCRETAPTPEGLQQIESWLRQRGEDDVADFVCFASYSGLRLNEARPLDWEAVDFPAGVLHVRREKRGINNFVPILPEMEALLRNMRTRAKSHLLFPSPLDTSIPREASAMRHRLTAACKALGLRHCTLHGLRSYFVTQARQSGLSDATVAKLIGDKSGAPLIAAVYGDIREDYLMQEAKRIRLTPTKPAEEGRGECSTKLIHSLPTAPDGFTKETEVSQVGEAA